MKLLLSAAFLLASVGWASAQPANVTIGGCAYYATPPVAADTGYVVSNCDTGGAAKDGGYTGATAFVVGTAQTAGHALLVNATVAGNVAVTFTDGSIMTFAVPVGVNIFKFAITTVNTSGTTATATYYNLR